MRNARALALALSLPLVAACERAAPIPRGPLEGAWEVLEVRYGPAGSDTGSAATPPGQFLFTGARYSSVFVPQAQSRAPSAKHWEPTDAEMVAHFKSVVANSGSYEVSGSRVTLQPIVAKMPEFSGGRLTYEFRIQADTLFLEAVDEKSSGGIMPPNYDAGRERLKLLRVEGAAGNRE